MTTLKDRKNALEREFFSRQDEEAIEKLRSKNAAKARRSALQEAAGISNESVLEAIEGAGINAESLTALSLIPLIAVAWADGARALADDPDAEADGAYPLADDLTPERDTSLAPSLLSSGV